MPGVGKFWVAQMSDRVMHGCPERATEYVASPCMHGATEGSKGPFINYVTQIKAVLDPLLPPSVHGCFIPIEPVTKRLRPVIRNFFIATDLITTLATNMGLR